MTKWEYYIVEANPTRDAYDVDERMNELGAEGWECYAVDGGIAYFRRPKKSVPVRVGPEETKGGPSV